MSEATVDRSLWLRRRLRRIDERLRTATDQELGPAGVLLRRALEADKNGSDREEAS